MTKSLQSSKEIQNKDLKLSVYHFLSFFFTLVKDKFASLKQFTELVSLLQVLCIKLYTNFNTPTHFKKRPLHKAFRVLGVYLILLLPSKL